MYKGTFQLTGMLEKPSLSIFCDFFFFTAVQDLFGLCIMQQIYARIVKLFLKIQV